MKEKADIGLIGLAVMGENLVLNMESKGLTELLKRSTNLLMVVEPVRIL
jgi:6-phosphogluconate dehydrogenase